MAGGGAAKLAADAVRADAWTIVDRLLEADLSGSLLHLDLEGGNSLLHLAAFSGSTNAVAVILRHGACISALNAAGQNAVDLAFLSGHDAVVEQLRTGNVSVQRSLAGGTSLAGQTDAASEVLPAPELALVALPMELIVRIIRCMQIRDVLACSQVCWRFNLALEDAWLWESLCWSHWRCDSLQARRGLCTWRDVYKEQFVCRRAQARHREQREEERRAPRRERADEFGTPPRIVASMATSIEELFEPIALSPP